MKVKSLAVILGTAMLMLHAAPAIAADVDVQNTQRVTAEYVEVEAGKLMGYKQDGVYRFLGVPYGQAERFQDSVKVEPWEGVRTAFTQGYVSPQDLTKINNYDFATYTETNMIPNEAECLNLNVWTGTLETDAKRPVLLFIHGGGQTSGSSFELVTYDGANLAGKGDIVFVSCNMRLNVLGYLDVSAYGDEYKHSGNAAMMDIKLALEWIRDNIEQFGGDPDNVTIMGQSGGCTKISAMMCMPSARGLFHKAFIDSGSIAHSFGVSQEEAQAQTAALVANLGLSDKSNEEIMNYLVNMDYDDLLAASNEAGFRASPVIDGDIIQETLVDADGNFNEVSNDIPLLISWVSGEKAGNQVAIMGPHTLEQEFINDHMYNTMTEDEIYEKLKEQYGDKTDVAISAFESAYPGHDIFELIYIPYRNNIVPTARVNSNGAPVYLDVIAYTYPIFGGMMSAHSVGCFPMFFYNCDKVGWQVAGDEEIAYSIAEQASTALINFLYTGDPSQDGLEWPAFTVENGETMIFDVTSEVRNYHDRELMNIIDPSKAW